MMPDALNIQDIVEVTYEKFSHVHDGEVATYIPELGKVDPNNFAICVAAVDARCSRPATGIRSSPSSQSASRLLIRWLSRNWGVIALYCTSA